MKRDFSALEEALIIERPYWTNWNQREWERYFLERLAQERGIIPNEPSES